MMQLTMTVEQAAATLGIGTATVRRMLRGGELKPIGTPAGKKVLVSAFSVLAALGAPEPVLSKLAADWLAELGTAANLEQGQGGRAYAQRPAGRPRRVSMGKVKTGPVVVAEVVSEAGGKLQPGRRAAVNHGNDVAQYIRVFESAARRAREQAASVRPAAER